MARNKKRKNHKKNSFGTIFAIILAIVTLMILVSGFVFLKLKSEPLVKIDDETLCPEAGATSTTAILLDTTDEISIATTVEIQEQISIIFESLPRYARLSIHTVDENGLNVSLLGEVCNPGRLDQMGELERKGFTANPALIKSRYEAFLNELKSVTNVLFDAEFQAKESPLLSALQTLSLTLPKPIANEVEKSGRNRIIFISDFMEHTDIFSNYRSNLDLPSFKRSRAKEKFGRKYGDVELEFWMIRRNNKNFTSSELRHFWMSVFKDEFESDIDRFTILAGEI